MQSGEFHYVWNIFKELLSKLTQLLENIINSNIKEIHNLIFRHNFLFNRVDYAMYVYFGAKPMIILTFTARKPARENRLLFTSFIYTHVDS
jgi:hypothetical protein